MGSMHKNRTSGQSQNVRICDLYVFQLSVQDISIFFRITMELSAETVKM